MWRIVVFASLLSIAPALAQSITVFGNSDAQQCYMYTKLPGGLGGLQYCNRALNVGSLSDRDRAATLVNRGILYNHTRQLSQAEADFVEALKLDSDLAEAYVNWGNTKIFLEDFVTAKDYYSKAIELGTKDLHAAYYNRGLANEALSDLNAAFKDFVDAERVKPEWKMAMERIERYEANGFKRVN